MKYAYGFVVPDSIVRGPNMGPTWVLSAPDGPHVGPMNLARGVGWGCFILLWFISKSKWFVGFLWTYSSGLLHGHWGNHMMLMGHHMIAPMAVKQSWKILVSLTFYNCNNNTKKIKKSYMHNSWGWMYGTIATSMIRNNSIDITFIYLGNGFFSSSL